MRCVLQTLAAVAALAVLGAGAVVGFGLYDVSARKGHLPGVSWVLHTTFRNAVRLRAPPPSQVPELDDPALVELGARHYDSACRACHARPGQDRTATMAAMVPAPPPIADAVKDWAPRHLHWIVANGIKMSGMPAWPAARDDDVWAVVAFLEKVRQGMDAADYAALTRRPPGMAAPLAYCTGCHGDGGSDHVPRLDIQTAAYLEMSLRAYRDGRRASGIMHHAASVVPETAIAELAAHFAEQAPQGAGAPQPPGLVAQGRALAGAATRDADVPACRACHGPGATEASDLFPALAGLPAPYLRAQLMLWRDGDRGGGARSALMRAAAQGLEDGDIAALAAFYASLPPAGGR